MDPLPTEAAGDPTPGLSSMNARWACLAVVALLGCGTTRGATTAKAPDGSGGATDAALGRLSRRPAWLFPFTQCPADAFPGTEVSLQYQGEACAADLAACIDRCESNDANACYAAALRVQELKAPPDYAEALFLKACRGGMASGCTNRAAGMLMPASPGAEPWPCVNRTFEAMCGRSDPWACTMWGASLLHGNGVPRDLDRARSILPKGCLLGEDDPACEAARKLLVEANATST